MTILTFDQAMAGMQPVQYINKISPGNGVIGRWFSLWYTGGIPPGGKTDTTTVGGVSRTSSTTLVVGQIPHYDPPVGQSSYLAIFGIAPNSTFGQYMLADRLWDCGANTTSAFSPTLTVPQTVNSVAWPSRDDQGTANGYGVMIALEVSTTMGAGAPKFNISYTSAQGVSGKQGINADAYATTSAVPSFYPFTTNTADKGVQSVQSITASATQTTGQWNLVAYNPITSIELASGSVTNAQDVLAGGFPQIYNGAVPFILVLTATAAAYNPVAFYQETQG